MNWEQELQRAKTMAELNLVKASAYANLTSEELHRFNNAFTMRKRIVREMQDTPIVESPFIDYDKFVQKVGPGTLTGMQYIPESRTFVINTPRSAEFFNARKDGPPNSILISEPLRADSITVTNLM